MHSFITANLPARKAEFLMIMGKRPVVKWFVFHNRPLFKFKKQI